ncbi:MAG: response regulator [Verrucomicrobiota bacterium]
MRSEKDSYDYKRYAILFVDDEATSRKYFQRLFGAHFWILEAEDGADALKVFQENANDIAVIVTDQRMPNETGVGFLSKIASDYPDVIKILSTAYADLEAAIGSVNRAGIFRYVTKPWDIPELEITLRRAMEFHLLKRERDTLLLAKILAVGNVLLANRLAAFAFVPVCGAISCSHAAEAIASFIRLAISSRDFSVNPKSLVSTPDLAKLHARQIELACLLESKLPLALAEVDIASRVTAMAKAMEAAGARSVSVNTQTWEIRSDSDPMPQLLEAILGHESDSNKSIHAVAVLASLMAIYDSGYKVTRKRCSTLHFEICPRQENEKEETKSPGYLAAKWLMEDELLVSAALGIL